LSKSLRRPQDLIARYGGEEFIALLPDTDILGALTIGKKMRMNVKGLEIPHSHSLAADVVSISAGIANIVPTNEIDPGTLIQAADRALYEAKKESRDTCKIFSPEEMLDS
jgi:two-component system cell cycle response regulator